MRSLGSKSGCRAQSFRGRKGGVGLPPGRQGCPPHLFSLIQAEQREAVRSGEPQNQRPLVPIAPLAAILIVRMLATERYGQP